MKFRNKVDGLVSAMDRLGITCDRLEVEEGFWKLMPVVDKHTASFNSDDIHSLYQLMEKHYIDEDEL